MGALIATAPYAIFLWPDDSVIKAGDYSHYQLPAREFAREEILGGRLPLWCSYLTCGAPIHATQQAGFAYLPVTVAVLLLGANIGLKLNVFLHVLVCYVGQYRLTRFHDVSRPASVFSAIVACQSGFLIFHLQEGHLALALEYALIPWFFLTLVRFLKAPAATRTVALASVVALLAIGGQPQLLYYCLLTGGLLGLGAVVAGAGDSRRSATIIWGVVGAGIAILLSGIQTGPTMELMRDGYESSDRGSLAYASTYAAHPADILTFWWPYYMGSSHADVSEFGRSGGFIHERTNYLGVVVPLLALLGLAKQVERWQWPLAGLIVLCWLIAIGTSTPLFAFLGSFVPGFYSFRCPGRTLAIVAILMPLLAARGLDSWIERRPWESGRRLVAAAALAWLVGSALLDSAARLVDLGDEYVDYLRREAMAPLITTGVLTILAVCVLLALPGLARWHKLAAYAVLLWLVANDLWITNAQHVRLVPPKQVKELPEASPGDPTVRIVDAPYYPRFVEYNLRYSSIVPVAIRYGWTSVMTDEGGVEPASIRRMHAGIFDNTLPALQTTACNWLWRDGPWEPLAGPLPRARFLPSEHQDLCEVPLTEITREQVEQLAEASRPCRIEWDRHSELAVTVEAPTAGIVVLADTHYPGWKCRAEGSEREILLVHGAFRGVRVPAGRHRLVFSYESRSFVAGLGMTLSGLVAAAALVIVGRRKHTRATGQHL